MKRKLGSREGKWQEINILFSLLNFLRACRTLLHCLRICSPFPSTRDNDSKRKWALLKSLHPVIHKYSNIEHWNIRCQRKIILFFKNWWYCTIKLVFSFSFSILVLFRCSGRSSCDVYLLWNKQRDEDITLVCHQFPDGIVVIKYLCFSPSSTLGKTRSICFYF